MLAQNFRNKTVSYLSLCFVLFCGACKSRTKANLNNSNKYIETPADSFGNKGLIWGSFFQFGESITADNFQKIILSNKYKNLAKQSARSCEKMKSDFGLTFEAIENFSFESVLPSDATFKASNVAGMEIERIYMSAVCATTSQNLDERKKP